MAEKFNRYHENRDFESKNVDCYDDGLLELEQSSMTIPIPESNLGYKLLLKQGWKDGKGLGRAEQGRLDPLPIVIKEDIMGFGRWEMEMEQADETTEKRRVLETEKEDCPELREKYKATQEKEKAIEEGLASLKANFYCGLCEKQYYKYQEFDNHMNSYDHAHRKRQREQRQRELGRSTPIKLSKQGKKKEKEAKRLLQLAEIRAQAAELRGPVAMGTGDKFIPGGGFETVDSTGTERIQTPKPMRTINHNSPYCRDEKESFPGMMYFDSHNWELPIQESCSNNDKEDQVLEDTHSSSTQHLQNNVTETDSELTSEICEPISTEGVLSENQLNTGLDLIANPCLDVTDNDNGLELKDTHIESSPVANPVDGNTLTSDEKLLASDEQLLASDEQLLASDEKLLTLDEELLTSDEKLLTSDEKLLTLDEKLLTLDEKLNEPSTVEPTEQLVEIKPLLEATVFFDCGAMDLPPLPGLNNCGDLNEVSVPLLPPLPPPIPPPELTNTATDDTLKLDNDKETVKESENDETKEESDKAVTKPKAFLGKALARKRLLAFSSTSALSFSLAKKNSTKVKPEVMSVFKQDDDEDSKHSSQDEAGNNGNSASRYPNCPRDAIKSNFDFLTFVKTDTIEGSKKKSEDKSRQDLTKRSKEERGRDGHYQSSQRRQDASDQYREKNRGFERDSSRYHRYEHGRSREQSREQYHDHYRERSRDDYGKYPPSHSRERYDDRHRNYHRRDRYRDQSRDWDDNYRESSRDHRRHSSPQKSRDGSKEKDLPKEEVVSESPKRQDESQMEDVQCPSVPDVSNSPTIAESRLSLEEAGEDSSEYLMKSPPQKQSSVTEEDTCLDKIQLEDSKNDIPEEIMEELKPTEDVSVTNDGQDDDTMIKISPEVMDESSKSSMEGTVEKSDLEKKVEPKKQKKKKQSKHKVSKKKGKYKKSSDKIMKKVLKRNKVFRGLLKSKKKSSHAKKLFETTIKAMCKALKQSSSSKKKKKRVKDSTSGSSSEDESSSSTGGSNSNSDSSSSSNSEDEKESDVESADIATSKVLHEKQSKDIHLKGKTKTQHPKVVEASYSSGSVDSSLSESDDKPSDSKKAMKTSPLGPSKEIVSKSEPCNSSPSSYSSGSVDYSEEDLKTPEKVVKDQHSTTPNQVSESCMKEPKTNCSNVTVDSASPIKTIQQPSNTNSPSAIEKLSKNNCKKKFSEDMFAEMDNDTSNAKNNVQATEVFKIQSIITSRDTVNVDNKEVSEVSDFFCCPKEDKFATSEMELKVVKDEDAEKETHPLKVKRKARKVKDKNQSPSKRARSTSQLIRKTSTSQTIKFSCNLKCMTECVDECAFSGVTLVSSSSCSFSEEESDESSQSNFTKHLSELKALQTSYSPKSKNVNIYSQVLEDDPVKRLSCELKDDDALMTEALLNIPLPSEWSCDVGNVKITESPHQDTESALSKPNANQLALSRNVSETDGTAADMINDQENAKGNSNLINVNVVSDSKARNSDEPNSKDNINLEKDEVLGEISTELVPRLDAHKKAQVLHQRSNENSSEDNNLNSEYDEFLKLVNEASSEKEEEDLSEHSSKESYNKDKFNTTGMNASDVLSVPDLPQGVANNPESIISKDDSSVIEEKYDPESTSSSSNNYNDNIANTQAMALANNEYLRQLLNSLLNSSSGLKMQNEINVPEARNSSEYFQSSIHASHESPAKKSPSHLSAKFETGTENKARRFLPSADLTGLTAENSLDSKELPPTPPLKHKGANQEYMDHGTFGAYQSTPPLGKLLKLCNMGGQQHSPLPEISVSSSHCDSSAVFSNRLMSSLDNDSSDSQQNIRSIDSWGSNNGEQINVNVMDMNFQDAQDAYSDTDESHDSMDDDSLPSDNLEDSPFVDASYAGQTLPNLHQLLINEGIRTRDTEMSDQVPLTFGGMLNNVRDSIDDSEDNSAQERIDPYDSLDYENATEEMDDASPRIANHLEQRRHLLDMLTSPQDRAISSTENDAEMIRQEEHRGRRYSSPRAGCSRKGVSDMHAESAIQKHKTNSHHKRKDRKFRTSLAAVTSTSLPPPPKVGILVPPSRESDQHRKKKVTFADGIHPIKDESIASMSSPPPPTVFKNRHKVKVKHIKNMLTASVVVNSISPPSSRSPSPQPPPPPPDKPKHLIEEAKARALLRFLLQNQQQQHYAMQQQPQVHAQYVPSPQIPPNPQAPGYAMPYNPSYPMYATSTTVGAAIPPQPTTPQYAYPPQTVPNQAPVPTYVNAQPQPASPYSYAANASSVPVYPPPQQQHQQPPPPGI